MSGVAGAYQQIDGSNIARSLGAQLCHRGPDRYGEYSSNDSQASIVLVHRRLSVVDHALGTQPLVKHGLALSYNGEIYNHRELAGYLRGTGARFETSSDTEVVLEAWRHWGPTCVRKFRGMFALALYDTRRGSLFLARDQLGLKPMYYVLRKDGVVFASEMKALLAVLGDELQVSTAGLVASLTLGYTPENRCMVDGVNKVLPGTYEEFRPDGSHGSCTYFDLSEMAAAAIAGPPLDSAQELAQAVTAQMTADCHVSSFIGTDLGSWIVTSIAKSTDPDVDAYALSGDRPRRGRPRAIPAEVGSLARAQGLDVNVATLPHFDLTAVEALVGFLDEPVLAGSFAEMASLCRQAHEGGVKVALCGLGAEEVFARSAVHFGCHEAQQLQRQGFPARDLAHLRSETAKFTEHPEEEAFRSTYSKWEPSALTALLHPDLLPHVNDALADHLELYSDTYLEDPVNRVCLAQARDVLPASTLELCDRAGMASSVEIRLPFMDVAVLRAAFSLDGAHKVGNGGELVQVARKWVPGRLVERATHGTRDWWAERELWRLALPQLLDGELVSRGFLRRHAVARAAVVAEQHVPGAAAQIHQLLVTELWFRRCLAYGVSP